MSTAVAVTFTPNANPKFDRDEANVDFAPSASRKRRHSAQAPPAPAPPVNTHQQSKGKGKGKASNQPADLCDLVHAAEWSNSPTDQPFKHKFEYTIEEASFSAEKYALFHKYQTLVHGESESKVTPKGFRRFLCDTPLDVEPSPSGETYGSMHGLWRLDGKLIALAVLDILPGAVSSVYFCYDKDYSGMSLGKISALREAAMARELGGAAYMMGEWSLPSVRNIPS